MKRHVAVSLLLLIGLLGGCAQQSVKDASEYRMQALQLWYEQENWRFSGRLGVVSERESFSANIDWRHEPVRDVIEMAGPWGMGRVRLVISDGVVEVDDGEQVRIYHETAEIVMARYFGVDLPVKGFQYWVLGLVEPGVDYARCELGFDQHGWRVLYRQMQPVNGGVLPRKINMEKDRTKVKLIVDHWKLS